MLFLTGRVSVATMDLAQQSLPSTRREFLLELNEIARPQCVSGDGRVAVLATGR